MLSSRLSVGAVRSLASILPSFSFPGTQPPKEYPTASVQHAHLLRASSTLQHQPSQLSVKDAVALLQSKYDALPNHEKDLAEISEPLARLLMAEPADKEPDMWPTEDMMAGEPAPDFDVLLTDLGPKDLHGAVSRALELAYLSTAQEPAVWPLQGVCYGPLKRCMFAMPVSFRHSCIFVHFLFDTASPTTFLSQEVLHAVGWESWHAHTPLINGVEVSTLVHCSDGQYRDSATGEMRDRHFKGLNLLGMDFMWRSGAMFSLQRQAGPRFIQAPVT